MRARWALPAALATASCWPAFAAAAATADVVAFTLSTIPVRAHGARVYALDARDRLAAALGAELPSDAGPALAAARKRLDTREGRALRAALARAAAGNALAARLGVERLPAVVVAGRYVVYGVRDVRRAVETVRAWRADHERSVDSGPGDARPFLRPPSGTPPARFPLRSAAR